MKIGIIGAGFTGLAAAKILLEQGHSVTIFEHDALPGGLAVGYKEASWKWSLEKHYHHWFTNDHDVLTLAKNISHKVFIQRPKTSSLVKNDIYQLDSPLSLLRFPKLPFTERLRMGLSLACLRYNPFWQPLENFTAEEYLKKTMGKKGYEMIWKPLMKNKLGMYQNEVSLAWFWARVYKRTSNLAYPEGGFLEFAYHLENVIKNLGGNFYYNTDVVALENAGKPILSIKKSDTQKSETLSFDAIIATIPSFVFSKISADLPSSYTTHLNSLSYIGATNLILRLSKPFFPDDTYWLNMCDTKSPILAIVEHTNFMDKKYYNNEHLVYLGNYLPATDPHFKLTASELLKKYHPWLRKINPGYASYIIDYKLFRAPFAQPIIPKQYSKMLPSLKTPLPNVYLANMQQVYPWDRGTNYAVELGKKVAQLIMS